MKSQAAASIFACLLACYLPACFGNYTEHDYFFIKMDPYDKSSSILSHSESCQSCLIGKAGISVVSFDLITPFVSLFKIRYDTLGFRRIQMYCNYVTLCPSMYLLRLHDLKTSKVSTGIDGETYSPHNVVHADLLEYLHTETPPLESSSYKELINSWTHWILGTQPMKYSESDEDLERLLERYAKDVPLTPVQSLQDSDSIATGDSEDKLLYLAQERDKVTADCRSCIRQASGSESLGEFPFVKHKVDYILYVMRTSVSRNEITSLCMSCKMPSVFQYHDSRGNPYELVHIKGVKEYYHSITIKDRKLKAEKVNGNQHERLACIAVSGENFENINDVMKKCMACLPGRSEDTFVHWMNAGADPSQSAYLLFSLLSLEAHIRFEEMLFGKICEHTHPESYLVPTEECYKDYYAQFEATPAIEGQVSVHAENWIKDKKVLQAADSVCIMAYYDSQVFCSACLDNTIGSTSTIQTRASAIKPIKYDFIEHLGLCIKHDQVPQCDKLVLLPKQLCNYRHTRLDSPPSKYKAQFNTLDEKSKHLNVGNECSVEKEKGQGSTHAASLSHESHHKSHLTRQNSPVTIVLVPYSDPRCAACFLLVHEVLMVSTKPKYVWMVEPKNHARHCDCEYVKKSKFVYCGPFALHQIPLREMELHLNNAKISVDSLPIHPRYEANIQTAINIKDKE